MVSRSTRKERINKDFSSFTKELKDRSKTILDQGVDQRSVANSAKSAGRKVSRNKAKKVKSSVGCGQQLATCGGSLDRVSFPTMGNLSEALTDAIQQGYGSLVHCGGGNQLNTCMGDVGNVAAAFVLNHDDYSFDDDDDSYDDDTMCSESVRISEKEAARKKRKEKRAEAVRLQMQRARRARSDANRRLDRMRRRAEALGKAVQLETTPEMKPEKVSMAVCRSPSMKGDATPIIEAVPSRNTKAPETKPQNEPSAVRRSPSMDDNLTPILEAVSRKDAHDEIMLSRSLSEIDPTTHELALTPSIEENPYENERRDQNRAVACRNTSAAARPSQPPPDPEKTRTGQNRVANCRNTTAAARPSQAPPGPDTTQAGQNRVADCRNTTAAARPSQAPQGPKKTHAGQNRISATARPSQTLPCPEPMHAGHRLLLARRQQTPSRRSQIYCTVTKSLNDRECSNQKPVDGRKPIKAESFSVTLSPTPVMQHRSMRSKENKRPSGDYKLPVASLASEDRKKQLIRRQPVATLASGVVYVSPHEDFLFPF